MWNRAQITSSCCIILVVVFTSVQNSGSVMVVTGSKLLLDCPGMDENPVISVKGSGTGDNSPSSSSSSSSSTSTRGGGAGFSSSVEVGGDKSDEAWDRFRPMLLKCKAAYPITWDFMGSKPPDLSVETIVEVDNVLTPTKRCFYSNLKVLASGYTGKESRTGNYTCKSFDGQKKASIYRFAHDGTSIFNTRKTMEAKVIVRGGVAQVFIPCTANIPNLNATVLRIQDENKNVTFVSLDANSIEQKYDPKVGFFLRSKNVTALSGKFVCSGTYRNETEVVEITVAPPTDFIVSPTKQHQTFRNSRISVSCRANEPVEMRLNNTNVKVQQHLQELMYKTDSLKYGAMGEVFTHPKQEVLKGEISCVKKLTGEVLYTWKYDTDYMCTCNWTLKPDLFKTTRFFFLLDRTLRGTIRAFGLNTEGDSYYMNLPTPRGELSCTSPKSAKVNMTYIACENPVECQIKSAFLNWFDFDHRAYAMESAFSDEDGEDAANQTTISQGYIRSGIIKCGVEDYITTKIAIANLDTLYIDSIPMKNLVRIIAPESNVFVGDKMLFTCIYEKFQIAREAKFAVQYKNGTINFLEIDKMDDRYSFDLEKYQRTSYITIDSPDISSLLCFVPVWNSTQWKNTSLPLNVSTASPITSDSPLNCPTDSSPIIILQRNSTISSRRVRVPHLVSNTTISLYNPVSEIQLICRANYPIQWVYNDVPLNTSKIGKVPCSQSSSMKKVYEAILHIDPLKKEGTGNYSCRKTFAVVPQSYVYVYAVGDGDATFVNEGRHMQVVKHTDDPNQKVILPCQVSNPEAKPYLFLDHEDSEKIQRLDFSEELQYDPRSGFELDLSLAPEPVTTFICSMSSNASSFGVLITLRKQDGIFAAGASGGSGSYKDSQSNGMLIGVTVILLILVIVLTSGLYLMYKKCQEATSKTADVSQLGNTTGFSSYDDVRIQADDRENIVGDGTYNRFN